MAKRKKESEDSERWMISYADLLTLMLAFFIVLYSQSQTNVSRLREVAKGMIEAFNGDPAVLMHQGEGGSGILKHHRAATPKPMPRTPHLDAHTAHRLDLRVSALQRAEKSLRKVLHPLLQTQQVKLGRHPLSLHIRLNATILYTSGQATLTAPAKKILKDIAKVIGHLPHDYPVVVQGYTDDQPIHTEQFPSNWQLSTARSISVVSLFMQNGLPGQQLSAQGFSKYHPLKSNATEDGRRVNRRVEIIINSPAAKSLEARQNLKQANKRQPHRQSSVQEKNAHGE